MRDGHGAPRQEGGAGKKLKALLDVGSGIQLEGFEVPDDPQLVLAIKAWNLLSNGTGGIDFYGLPVVADMLGIESTETLLDLILVIKSHGATGEEERD